MFRELRGTWGEEVKKMSDSIKPGTPLVIRIYDDTGEYREFTQPVVPWGVLKAAVRVAKTVNMQDPSEEDVDIIAGLVVMAFKNRFSVSDLDGGADITEMMAILSTIMAKANAWEQAANPTFPR